jgi:hypothetical protein
MILRIPGCTSTRRPARCKHILWKQLGMILTNIYIYIYIYIYTSNNILICKAILKPTWTYGIQLWGSASTSNMEILENLKFCTQLLMHLGTCWIWLSEWISKYQQLKKKFATTALNTALAQRAPNNNRWLRGHMPNDLPTRFLAWLIYL